MKLSPTSLERLIPDQLEAGEATGDETLRLHVERYEFAARNMRPGHALDCACGVGYGTRILSDNGDSDSRATGVDVSKSAVEYARDRYATDRIRYVESDALQFEGTELFDTIVSIETIEHLREPTHFIDHIRRQLSPGGIFVASVPVTPTVDVNPHHLHDFSEKSFRQIFLQRGFVEVDSLAQEQSARLTALLSRSEARMEQMRPNLPSYYLSHPGAFLRRVASVARDGLTTRYLTIAWRSVS